MIENDNPNLTTELVRNIPYASSILKIGKGTPGLIILESKSDNQEIWVSADNVFIVLSEGRIVKTNGLANNLTRFSSSIRASSLLSFDNSNLTYYYSYDLPQLIDLEVKSEIRLIGKDSIKILDKEMNLNLIEEKISNNYLGWNVINKFWLDDEGFVWKSLQHISPKLPPFIIQVTKKPAN